jgi:hypothetical protein
VLCPIQPVVADIEHLEAWPEKKVQHTRDSQHDVSAPSMGSKVDLAYAVALKAELYQAVQTFKAARARDPVAIRS